MEMPETEPTAIKHQGWNAGRAVGAKRALKPKQVWEIRFYLNQRRRLRDRALFDLTIDSKLRGCDLVRMKIGDIVSVGQIRTRDCDAAENGKACSIRTALPRPCQHFSGSLNADATRWTIMSFQVGLITAAILAAASTPGLWMNG
jgi:hypothetical protein